MRDRLTAVLDQSLKRNGVQLTRQELPAVMNDLMIFLDGELAAKEVVSEPEPETVPMLQPPPPPGGAGN